MGIARKLRCTMLIDTSISYTFLPSHKKFLLFLSENAYLPISDWKRLRFQPTIHLLKNSITNG